MKRVETTVRALIPAALAMIVLWGCSGSRQIRFADEKWRLSEHFGQIINEDTTYRLTFGNRLIPVDMPVIASDDSLAAHKGLDRFMAQILHTTGLDSAEVLFYAPGMSLMFARPKPERNGIQPSSISSNIHGEHPCTIWVYDDFGEDWVRRPDEMFTYTFVDRRRKQILIVDYFTYMDAPLAQIKVLQTQTSRTKKLGFGRHTFTKNDINDRSKIEFWSSAIESHRKLAFGNYMIGQEIKKDRERKYTVSVAKADSCLIAKDYPRALDYLRKAISFSDKQERRIMFNTACAAAQTGELSFAMSILQQIAAMDHDWYLDNPIDEVLKPLTALDEWHAFADTMTSRMERIEANYDRPLRRRLLAIWETDQDVRHRFLQAYKSQPQDSALIKVLSDEMKEIDSKNLAEIKEILRTHGWPGKDLVGNACTTIWLVIQHSDIETQKEALPMLKEGVIRGELNPVHIAMLEDRILVNSGQEQIYGTQYYWEEDKNGHKEPKIYPIKDADKVDLRRESIGLEPLDDAYRKIKMQP
ncbi:MAG: hypothetical protein K2K76_04335 [Muribaculaceae bacterium]|nr:hypothetical protein [Muribaculaceae bacterium]